MKSSSRGGSRVALLLITGPAAAGLAAACAGAATSTPAATGTRSSSSIMTAATPTPAVTGGISPAAPAQAYVDAVNRNDLDALVLAFAPDGQVIDVTRPIRGRDAIRTWADNEVMGGHLEVLSVTPMPGGQDLLVRWAPRGLGGWQAHYRFTMTDSAITTADLQYA